MLTSAVIRIRTLGGILDYELQLEIKGKGKEGGRRLSKESGDE
ncbi:hypothetical protein Vi05172_g13705 [Venturia inaequalis]|nr:hypothetical protein Vi05172_g13705 [Venturia inaequalis]